MQKRNPFPPQGFEAPDVQPAAYRYGAYGISAASGDGDDGGRSGGDSAIIISSSSRSHSMKIDNSCIERVEEFKYLGAKLTSKNSIQEEIKSRLKVGNACYYSVQNLLSTSLLSKDQDIFFFI